MENIFTKLVQHKMHPVAKLMSEVIRIYKKEHSIYFTDIYKKYYISNILSFNQYYFDKKMEPSDYMYGFTHFPREEYNLEYNI